MLLGNVRCGRTRGCCRCLCFTAPLFLLGAQLLSLVHTGVGAPVIDNQDQQVQALNLKQESASDNATCLAERGDLVRCFEGMGTFYGYCDRCLAAALPATSDSCRDLNAVMCAAITRDCPCGLCADEAEQFLNCAFRVLVRCSLNCTDSSA
jgi:hypothetical protein